jgi:pimeloyl-[acyl-carrier protein] methyl ester esterase
VNLHIETCGAGENLVLLHGWGMHGGVWGGESCGIRDELARHFRLHIADLPGYGSSPCCAPYTLEHLAALVAERLPQRTHLCGWSLGGLVALEVARRFPEKVARLVLVASTPCFAQREDWRCAMAPETLREFAAALESDYEGTLKRFLALQARGEEGEKGAQAAKAVLRTLRDGLFTRGRPALGALRGGLEILAETDLRGQLECPSTLLVHGDRDLLSPLPAAQWLASHLPDARLEVFHGAAHAPFLSHPNQFVETVKNYLNAHG